MEIEPLNGHVLIRPVPHQTFVFSEKEIYDEIGTVLRIPEGDREGFSRLKVGDRVFFDSWMAAKCPTGHKEGEFFWLVKYDDIRAVQRITD